MGGKSARHVTMGHSRTNWTPLSALLALKATSADTSAIAGTTARTGSMQVVSTGPVHAVSALITRSSMAVTAPIVNLEQHCSKELLLQHGTKGIGPKPLKKQRGHHAGSAVLVLSRTHPQ